MYLHALVPGIVVQMMKGEDRQDPMIPVAKLESRDNVIMYLGTSVLSMFLHILRLDINNEIGSSTYTLFSRC